jgi:putative CocE/NonD family hydrolase
MHKHLLNPRYIQLAAAVLVVLAPGLLGCQDADSTFIRSNYKKYEYTVPMRDGVKLFTSVYVPNDASASNTYPIVLQRTPYSCAPYGPENYARRIGPSTFMMRDKYIFVTQDVRGRYMSEGAFVNARPFIADSIKARDPKMVDEASDTYDTIDWLLKNVANNNGKVGQWGISYPGFYASMGALSRHPALVLSSPQAPVTDFFFEDFHHNGALTQAYFYTYPIFGIPTPGPTTENWWASKMVTEGQGVADDYDFQLSLGPLKNVTEKYYKDNTLWQDIINHPNYDDFWQSRAVPPNLRGIKHAVLVVGGWFDAEDLYGPFTVYKTLKRFDPDAKVNLVVGPFRHGGWAAEGVTHTYLGDIYFGEALETAYQRDVEAPYFHGYLKGSGGSSLLPPAYMFDTGRRTWESFQQWPPKDSRTLDYYFHTDGEITRTLSTVYSEWLEYVSDPAKPVPSRCHGPTIQGLTLYQYMDDNQICDRWRPDVVTFETEAFGRDVTLAGDLTAHLEVSTTGTDADYVVKLIDVYPMNAPDAAFRPDTSVHMAGYQQLVRGEIMRARFRDSFTKPQPMNANRITHIKVHLQDVLHTFKAGHKMMVQIQSSWFPAFDRNPQKYVPNIYEADAADFVKQSERVYLGSSSASYIEVNQMP